MLILPALVNLLHPPPVHIATGFGLFQPGQLRIGFHHRIDGLADGLLVDLLDVDANAFGSLDDQLALGDQFGLAQGFVGLAPAFRGIPGPAALALLVDLLLAVLHPFEGDGAAAVQGQVVAAFQVGGLVGLVAFAGEDGSGASLLARALTIRQNIAFSKIKRERWSA